MFVFEYRVSGSGIFGWQVDVIGSCGGLVERRERVQHLFFNICNFRLWTGYFWFEVDHVQEDIFVACSQQSEAWGKVRREATIRSIARLYGPLARFGRSVVCSGSWSRCWWCTARRSSSRVYRFILKWVGFSGGIDINLVFAGGWNSLDISAGDRYWLDFSVDSELTWFLCWWSKLTWFVWLVENYLILVSA